MICQHCHLEMLTPSVAPSEEINYLPPVLLQLNPASLVVLALLSSFSPIC